MKYVLGGSPLIADAPTYKPTAVKSGTSPSFIHTLTFKRSLLAKADSKTVVTVEYSSDMSTWTSIAIGQTTSSPVTVSASAGNPDTISVAIPAGSATKIFSRVKVVVSP